jgi:uncharacterized protein
MGSFLVNVGEVLRHPGHLEPLALSGPIPGIALSSARVDPGADVRLDGSLEAQGTMVIVQGTVRAPWVGECRRCLEVTGGELHVELREVFEPEPVEGETFPLQDEVVDLEPVLREVVALALPVAPLCSEDCAGPDPEAHPVGGQGPGVQDGEPAGEPRGDPRWAVLDQLRQD